MSTGVRLAIANGEDANRAFADGLTPLCRMAALGERRIEGEVENRSILDVDPEVKVGLDVVSGLGEGGGQTADQRADEDEDEQGARDHEGEGGAEQARQELLTEVHVRWL